jgi:hypothetical protein
MIKCKNCDHDCYEIEYADDFDNGNSAGDYICCECDYFGNRYAEDRETWEPVAGPGRGLVRPKMEGHVVIRDGKTKDVICDVYNAINYENMSQALALSLANRPDGSILYMVFGNGGSVVSAIGTITYYPPNVSGSSATLYNQTYQKVVDDLSPLNTDPTECYMRESHVTGVPYSDIQVVCTLDYDEPSGQAAFDNAPVTNNTNPSGSGSALSTFIFDEIGLTTGGSSPLLLSHVIFHPVQKSLNRSIEVTYTLRIYLGS